MPRKLTDAQVDELCSRYVSGESGTSLAEGFGVSASTVYDWLGKRSLVRPLGATNKKRIVNDSAFDEITDESAYWIGFFMADGYISKTSGIDSIRLLLAARDPPPLH